MAMKLQGIKLLTLARLLIENLRSMHEKSLPPTVLSTKKARH